jgi:hypothetical protein
MGAAEWKVAVFREDSRVVKRFAENKECWEVLEK